MKSVIRPLVLLNILFAMVAIFPIGLFLAVENTARGILILKSPPPQAIGRDLQEIRAINDIETLRRRTFKLEQMLDFELRTRHTEIPFFVQLGEGFVLLLVIAGAGFLANAGFLAWVLRRQPGRQ